LPDEEGGILPPGKIAALFASWKFSMSHVGVRFFPPGWKPGSTAGTDACRYISGRILTLLFSLSRDGGVGEGRGEGGLISQTDNAGVRKKLLLSPSPLLHFMEEREFRLWSFSGQCQDASYTCYHA
jgi:hypothetical protein